MSVATGSRIGRRELFRLAEEEGQVVLCDACDWALDRDGRCPKCETRPKADAKSQLELSAHETEERPRAVDVTEWNLEGEDAADRSVVEDLIGESSLVALAGEEGEGKTLCSEQIARQVLRGDRVLDFFDLGELRPTKALFVDTEMEAPDARARTRDADARGLAVPPETMFWLTADEINLGESSRDRSYLEEEIARVGADLLWIDTGGNAVGDGKDDVQVRHFFNFLSVLRRDAGILAVGLTLQPRKRAQGEFSRRFDDLFGSREWKGRPHKAFYIEGNRITCWKDRGGHIRRRWPTRAGGRYPVATLLRPGLDDSTSVPYRVEVTAPEDPVDEATLRTRVISLLSDSPDTHAKTTVADRLGVRREVGLKVVEQMLSERVIGPDKPRAKLRVLNEGSFPLEKL